MTEQDQNRRFVEAFSSPNDRRFHRAAEDFYEAVRSAGFKWLGLGGVEDELGTPILVIYLAEPSTPRTVAVLPELAALQLADRSSIIIHNYYLLNDPVTNKSFAERALASMKARYGRENHDPKPELLWEEDF